MLRYTLTLLLLFTVNAEAALYRWVDEDGVTRFTTTLPPEAAQYDREVINKKGRTIKKFSGARTPEEIAEEERRQAEEDRKRRARMEAEKRDRALQAAYRDVSDIEYKRDTKLKALENKMQRLAKEVEKSQQEYAKLVLDAITQERTGNLPSEGLRGQIRSAEREQADHQARLTEAQEDQVNTTQAFADDIERFKKLKGIP